MTKNLIAAISLLMITFFPSAESFAQYAIHQEGEFGIGLGAGHYFGDLNTRAKLNRPKIAASMFFRKNLNNYIAIRVAGTFARLGYSDVYNKYNEYMYRRNLSFNSNVWELSLQGDFNFFRFMPGEPTENFTPYITFGVGVFSYDPYAYLQGKKIYLRPLGTEGREVPCILTGNRMVLQLSPYRLAQVSSMPLTNGSILGSKFFTGLLLPIIWTM
jgi:hypothetical protein